MGRRIDWLGDVERDRLITAREFNDGRLWWHRECGCLEGTIAGGWPGTKVLSELAAACEPYSMSVHERVFEVPWRLAPPSIRYPQAVKRFGKDRVVRAIKARAAKNHRVSLLPAKQQTETAGV